MNRNDADAQARKIASDLSFLFKLTPKLHGKRPLILWPTVQSNTQRMTQSTIQIIIHPNTESPNRFSTESRIKPPTELMAWLRSESTNKSIIESTTGITIDATTEPAIEEASEAAAKLTIESRTNSTIEPTTVSMIHQTPEPTTESPSESSTGSTGLSLDSKSRSRTEPSDADPSIENPMDTIILGDSAGKDCIKE